MKLSALIVGAGDHLGAALARRFVREGLHLVATRQRGDISGLVSDIERAGGAVTALHSDARYEAAVQQLVQLVETEIGPMAACVFNVCGNVRFPIGETSTQVYRKVWEMCTMAGFWWVAKPPLSCGRATVAASSSQAPQPACAAVPALRPSPAVSMRCAHWRRAWPATWGPRACTSPASSSMT